MSLYLGVLHPNFVLGQHAISIGLLSLFYNDLNRAVPAPLSPTDAVRCSPRAALASSEWYYKAIAYVILNSIISVLYDSAIYLNRSPQSFKADFRTSPSTHPSRSQDLEL
jgi:hypothetical protein